MEEEIQDEDLQEMFDVMYENGVEVFTGRVKNILFGFLAMGMTMGAFLISLGLLGGEVDIDNLVLGYVGGVLLFLGALFFAACTVVIFKNSVRKEPVLTFTKEGFTNKYQTYSKKMPFIPWDKVKDISVKNMATQDFVCIDIENEEEYLESASKGTRMAMKANMAMGFPAICISANGLKGFGTEELAELFVIFLNKHNGFEIVTDEEEIDRLIREEAENSEEN